MGGVQPWGCLKKLTIEDAGSSTRQTSFA